MILRTITSIIVAVGFYSVSSWLYLWGQAQKAEFAVAQLEDSNITSATVRWMDGSFPSTLVLLIGVLIVAAIWYTPIKNLINQTKEGETTE